MDIQAYIESGIIESYVLGLASTEEIAEVERLLLQYPEIRQAIDDFSLMLEHSALENAVAPPDYIKTAIMDAIKKEDSDSPAVPFESSKETRVVHITFFRKWRIVAAAAIIFLIASASLNIYLYNKYTGAKEQIAALTNDKNNLQASNQFYQTQLKQWNSFSENVADSGMIMVALKDLAGKSKLATILWNRKTNEVFLMGNKLPSPQPGKQYQLWALADGKPIDAGLLDDKCDIVCKMKTIVNAQTFAITLENAGGSKSPTLPAMTAKGNI